MMLCHVFSSFRFTLVTSMIFSCFVYIRILLLVAHSPSSQDDVQRGLTQPSHERRRATGEAGEAEVSQIMV